MNKPARNGRWLPGWLTPKVAAPAPDDAADYGTAFGLDLSMTEPAPAPPVTPAAAPEARTPPRWPSRSGVGPKPGR